MLSGLSYLYDPRGLVRLGALTTVLTIFLNPFAQQLVQPREIVERVELETGFPSASRYSRGVYETVSMVQLTGQLRAHFYRPRRLFLI